MLTFLTFQLELVSLCEPPDLYRPEMVIFMSDFWGDGQEPLGPSLYFLIWSGSSERGLITVAQLGLLLAKDRPWTEL